MSSEDKEIISKVILIMCLCLIIGYIVGHITGESHIPKVDCKKYNVYSCTSDTVLLKSK